MFGHLKTQLPMQNLLLLSLFSDDDASLKHLTLPLPKGILKRVEIAHIIYFEADEIITKVYFQDKTSVVVMKNIGHYVKKLITYNTKKTPPPYHFFPISQSLLINMAYFDSYDNREKCVTLKTGQQLTASRRGGQDLREYLQKLG
jgi:two-component system, LytTR family, response regulator